MKVFLVNCIESERGWGSKIESQSIFPTEKLALQYCEVYNKKYNSTVAVPDWYMCQEYVGPVDVNKQQFDKCKYSGNLVEIPDNWEYVE